jgi:HD domain
VSAQQFSTSPPAERWTSWQTLDSGRLALFVLTGLVVIASAFVAFQRAGQEPVMAIELAFGGYIAVGELLRLALPGGREAAPIAMVGAMSFAMLMSVHMANVTGPPPPVPLEAWQVVTVTAIGMTVGALPHVVAGRPAGLTGMCTRLMAVSVVAYAARPLWNEDYIQDHVLFLVLAMILLVTVGWLVDTLISAMIRADDVGAKFSVAIADEMRLQAALGAAVGASAIITVLAAEVMGLTELAVFLGPLLVIQVAFRRYAGIRATYLQTVRSLASVTEVGGYVERGHSRRVSRLAVAVGREVGMPEHELLDLEYASLMHDIGQLSLRDPIPGGATVLLSAADQQRVAELGAEVIKQAQVLDHVAELVRCQSMPYQSPGQMPPPLGSRIIRAVNAFDDMVGWSTERERSNAALDRLRLDTETEYDPGVVAALAEVAGRRLASRL